MQKQSIQTRLTRAFIGLAVGPLLLIGAWAIWQGFSYQKESLRLQQQLAERVSVEIQSFIAALEDDLHLAIQLQGVQGLADRQPFSALFGLLSFNDLYEELALLDQTGNELNKVARLEIITDSDLNTLVSTPEFDIPFTTGQTYYSPVRFDLITGEPLITIAIPVFDERLGTPQGVLVADVRLKKIWEIIARVPLGTQQTVYIVDAEHRVVAHRNPSVVLRGTQFSPPSQPGFAEGLESTFAILAMDDIQLGSQKLTIIAEQAVGEALALPINLAITTLMISLIAFGAASIIGLRAVRRIVRPIQDLATTAHAIRAGDLSRQAPITDMDEVGELAETFNTMTTQLHQTMQDLATELTTRQKMADELRESEAKTRAVLEAIPDTKFILDQDGTIIKYIPGLNFQPLISREQFINKKVQDVLPSELADQIYHHLHQALTTRHLQIFEYFLPAGVEPRYFEARMTLSGNQHVLAVIREITAQKQSEAEREKLIRELEAKNTELDRFTHTVSHDLKSPLITLRGFLHYLKVDALSFNQEQLDKDIRHITDSVGKMERLINELLELSKIGRLIQPPAHVSFTEIVRDALSRVQGRLDTRQIKVEVRGELPEVYGDRNRLVQVIQNLVDNAAKFMGDQPDPQIEIGVQTHDHKNIFYVKDNGVGIKPELFEKVFGIFNKLDAKSDGTGIGLAFVKRIIEVHGGRIWIESEGVGRGSTFFFTLD